MLKTITTSELLATAPRKYGRMEMFEAAYKKAGNVANVVYCGKHYATLGNSMEEANDKMKAFASANGLEFRDVWFGEVDTTSGKKTVGVHNVCVAVLDEPQPTGVECAMTPDEPEEQPVPRKATKKSMRADIRQHLEDALALAVACEDEATIAALTVALKVAHK